MTGRGVVDWLLQGDVAIQYQTRRDLLDEERPDLQRRILKEGWGARFLRCRNPDGTWGRGYYQPKWTSSHYTLLDLRSLDPPRHPLISESIRLILRENKNPDGGIKHGKTIEKSDVCLSGMFLSFACYFSESEQELEPIIDFILDQRMDDGGFNCMKNRFGARHSSVHSTLSVLEGILEYSLNGYAYRLPELERTAVGAREFLLQHRLFKSDHTGEVIHRDFLRLAYPPRWKYNILRALDYLRRAGVAWDDRLADAADVLLRKRRPNGRWPLQAAHPGNVHFQMEKPGELSRWNTLLALRVLRVYDYHGES